MFICKECNRPGEKAKERLVCTTCVKSHVRAWKNANPEKQRIYNRTPNARKQWKIQKKKRQAAEREIKHLCIEYLGSECQYPGDCVTPMRDGFELCTASYAFHHRDRSSKEFQVTAYIKNMKKCIFDIKSVDDLPSELTKELNKCDLLCQNCHHRLEYCDGCRR